MAIKPVTHRILSHSDANPADVPITGEQLTFDAGTWEAQAGGGGGHSQLHAIDDPLDHSGSITAAQHATPAGDLHPVYALDGDLVTHAGLPSVHHSQAHAIDGADHTGAITAAQHGTPAGDLHPIYMLDGDAITAAQHGALGPIVGAHGHDDLDTVTADQHHTEVHSAAEPGPHTFPGGTTTFLRGDGAFAVPPGGGGGGSATEVEVDLGAPAWRGRFTITDAGIATTSKVLVWQAPGPYTGKGTRADEATMDAITAIATPASGSATVDWHTEPMLAPRLVTNDGRANTDTYIPVTGAERLRFRDAFRGARRLGKVRGNVKFAYMVLT